MHLRRTGALIVSLFLFGSQPCLPQSFPAQNQAVTPAVENLTIQRVFHIAGVPGLTRNARGDLMLTGKQIAFNRKKKTAYAVPYERLRHVQLLRGERHYPEATYALVLATGGIGSLLLLKKRRMDVLVVDFVSERGGQMGMVIQLPAGDGVKCSDWLKQFGIAVEEPPLPGTPAKSP